METLPPIKSPLPVVEQQFYRGHQSWNYVEHLSYIPGRPMRVRIQRDAYDGQSYGKVDVLNTSGDWSLILQVGVEELGTAVMNWSYVRDNESIHEGEIAAARLVERARRILEA